jgi:hypothetical protein
MGFSGFMQKTSASRIAAVCLPAASLQIDAGIIDESGRQPVRQSDAKDARRAGCGCLNYRQAPLRAPLNRFEFHPLWRCCNAFYAGFTGCPLQQRTQIAVWEDFSGSVRPFP